MSLINQMLKDLEKRRADGMGAADSPLKGVRRYAVARQDSSVWMIVLLSGFVVVAAAAGYLGWAYWQAKSDTAQAQPSAQQPANQVARGEATAPRTEPRSEKPAQPRASTQKATSDTQQKQAVVARTDRVRETETDDDEPAAASDKQVAKRVRPLSAAQQAEVAYQAGYQHIARGRSEAGEQQLREALRVMPHHHRARELLAGVYIKAGRYVEAGKLLEEGIAQAPQHATFAKLYARVMLEQDDVKRAIRVMEQSAPPLQADVEYHALLAALYQRQGEHVKAAARYRDILKLNPGMGVWWVGLGISLEQLGKQDEAHAAYQQARATGRLNNQLAEYTNNRLAALRESGYPTN